MTDFLLVLASGITAGSSYALMGLAMVIIYKTSGVVNFAQGEMGLISAYITFMMLDYYGFGYLATFFWAFVFALFLGALMEFAILRRAKDPSVLGLMIITIGLEMILLGLVSWKFGADPKDMPFPISPFESIELVENIYISVLEVLTIGVATAVMLILFLFFRFSKLGVAMKAVQQNPMAAKLMGISTNRVLMITWSISSFVGALAALLIAPANMGPFMMWDPLLKGFAAAVMGGMTSLGGAVVGAYIVGIIENFFGTFISIEFKSVVAFSIIVIMLCVKPSGLFGRHYVKKV
ncbi:MAG: branched-chain amino acid ABC transporter permease [Deltaproteobacteria bacterium]|nr:branched-chain amino acid ABC transporter permease [Deltaproteobacteria bacterium]